VGVDTGRTADRTQTEHPDERRRVTVSEAADILGITAEAVRTRIKWGRLDSVKDSPKPGGTVYVLLEADQTKRNIDPTPQGQDQTADQTPPDATEGGSGGPQTATDRPFTEEEPERRSWWRRMFGS
jgi:hypothetical protein